MLSFLTRFSLPLDREKHLWITNVLTSQEYMIAALIITVFQMIIMPILFALHTHRLMKGSKTPKYEKDNGLRIRYMIIDNLSLAAIAFSFISGIITIANYAAIFNNSTCRIITITQNIFWLFTKVSIYIVVLLRLQAAFWGSAYEINRKFKNVCYVLIAAFTIILCIGTASPYPVGVDSTPLPHTNFCLLIIPPWLILTPMVFDICCSTLSMYLFMKPIRKIMKNSGGNTVELSKLLTKYVLISSIAIFSNLFSSIWFAITDILIFTYFDVFFNPICLVLMQIHHDDIYRFLCKYCDRAVGKFMHFPEHSVTENIMIEIQKDSNCARSPAVSPTAKSLPVPPASPSLTLEEQSNAQQIEAISSTPIPSIIVDQDS